MTRCLSLVAACSTLLLAAGMAAAQVPEPTPTPVPAPPAEVTAPAAPSVAPQAPPPAAAVSPAAAPSVAQPAAVPTPVAVPVARVTDAPLVAILQAPADNPFGRAVEVAAALPPKLTFNDAVANSAAFVSARVDPTGRIMGVRPQRDPIPSLAGEAQRSLSRWVFDPARKGSE